jgi:hypothetical protein
MRAPLGRLGIVALAAIVQLAVLALAHDLVYLARYGSRYGEALIHAGHGNGWRAAVATSVVLGGLAALVAIVRLARLHLQLRRLDATRTRAGSRLAPRALVRTWLRIGPALAISTVVLLTIQENLEQSAIGGATAGIGILLTPEYAGAVWIALAVGLAVGIVIALVAWRFEVLAARLRAAREGRAPTRPRTAVPRPAPVLDRPIASILGRRSALRAPPVASPAS